MVAEVIAGIIASSLALISDAGHMLTDAAAIALALIAARFAARPARGNLTYGLKRVEILSALANGITSRLLTIWFCYKAFHRLLEPPEVAGGLVQGTAAPTSPPSTATCMQSTASWRSTTCTYGKSPPASLPCPPTC